MSGCFFVKHGVDLIPVDGRKKGRPRKTWLSTFCDDLRAGGVSWSEAVELAADHVHWRNLLPTILRTDRRN